VRTTIVIADDHEILRDALSGHASKGAGFDVVACVGDAQDAVNECRRLRPDLLLLDIEMPGRDALGAIADVKAGSPGTRVVILTAYCRDAFIELALRSGVAGYLLKADPPPAIFEALAMIAGGGTAYSRAVRARMAQRDFGGADKSGGPTPLAELTPRELEVLRHIGRGLDNDQMAAAMFLSKRTVERHVARLMSTVAIRDRTGLVKLAYEHGLVV
jgi:DNA-binding NarL/FixJ family response regulator